MVPLVLLRHTGFGTEFLDAMDTPEAGRHCDGLVAMRIEADADRRQFTERLFPEILASENARGAGRIEFQQWDRLLRQVQRGKQVSPLPSVVERWPQVTDWVRRWNAVVLRVEAVDQAAASICERDRELARERLRGCARDERFGEAVFLSSPVMYRTMRHLLDRPVPDQRAKARRNELKFYGYLQRFTAKNETTSFFGPIGHGVLDDSQRSPVSVRTNGGATTGRLTRPAYWAVQAIADLVTRDRTARRAMPVRLGTTWRLDSDGLVHVLTGRHVRTTPGQAAILSRVDGHRTVAELAGLDGVDELDALLRKGILKTDLTVPSDEHDALGWLRARVGALPSDVEIRGRTLELIDSFARLCERFAPAPLPDKVELLGQAERLFTVATGAGANGADGRLYADRTLLYDEALGDVSVRLGPAMAEDLRTRLATVLDLCVSYSLVVQQVCRERATDLVLSLCGGRPVAYLRFLHELVARVPMADCLADPRVTAFTDALAERVRASTNDGVASLTARDVAPLLMPVPPGTMVSPDVFLVADDQAQLVTGEYRLVVGEVHHGCQVWTHLLSFWPDHGWLAGEIADRLPVSDVPVADVVYQRKQGKAFPKELPGLTVEFSGRSRKPREQVLRAADLDVVPEPDRLVLRASRRGHDITLYPGDPRATVSWLFGNPPVAAPPIRLGRHTPQVRVDGTVLQRARWRLEPADLEPVRAATSGHRAMVAVGELAERLGLPSRCFVRVDGERKPFFVDLHSVIGVDYLAAMTAQPTGADITEVLPDTRQWWLRSAGGGRRACEWRTAWIYGAGNG
jgi:hypothetical protein